jgi:site-specific DNA-cytosine methylase
LNAKNYGIPQNRERVFIIGIRDDVDNDFSFPKPFPLVKRLKDVLESEVDEKYFLSDKMISGLINHQKFNKFNPTIGENISSCITSRVHKMGNADNYIDVKKIGFINQDTQASQVISENGIMPNVCAGTHGYALGYVETNRDTKESLSYYFYEKTTTAYNISCNCGNEYIGFLSDLCHNKNCDSSSPGYTNEVSKDVQELFFNENKDRLFLRYPELLNFEKSEIKILGYTRNAKGKVTSRHEQELSNTIHTATGGGGNTDQFVLINSEAKIGSIRGRNLSNPLSIVSGLPTEQILEINEDDVAIIHNIHGGFRETEPRVFTEYSPTIRTASGGGHIPSVMITKKLTDKQLDKLENLVVDENIAGCITEAIGRAGSSDEYMSSVKRNAIITQRIRRLIPLETFRLMDFNFGIPNVPDFKWEVSDSQAYRQAGNSIVVNVLCEIIKKLKL